MEEITLKEACKNCRKIMKEDWYYTIKYEAIKDILKVAFNEENIDDEFYEPMTEEQIIDFVRNCFNENCYKDFFKIKNIEVVPEKKVVVRGSNNFDIDEFYVLSEIEANIAITIKALTGYSVDISL